MTSDQAVSRRGFIRGGTAGVMSAASITGVASAQEGEGTEAGQSTGGTEHTVDMTDGLVFEPAELTIAPGDTVVWENVGSIGHTVTAYEDDIPAGATFFASGGYESEQAARDAYPPGGDIPGGESYSHTFETTGTFEYFCIPHEAAGMLGTIIVQEDSGETGGPVAPAIPDAAKTILIGVFGAMIATLGLAYGFMKYGGARPADE